MSNYKKIKFIFVLFLFILFSNNSFAQTCYFNINNVSCEKLSLPFITFQLDIDPPILFKNFTARIYNKFNPSNQILLDINYSDQTIKNINPFIESGVYVLEINYWDVTNKKNNSKYEFKFDNLEPLPPLVKFGISQNKVNCSVNNFNLSVFAKLDDGTLLKASKLSNLNFSLNLNLNNGIHLIKFYTQNLNGENSTYLKRIAYIGGMPKENFSSPLIDLIIDSNLENFNENTIKNATNSYQTLEKYFYISGSSNSNDGSVIYVNGIKSLVKDKKFASIIELNEGKNDIEISNFNNSISKHIYVYYTKPSFKFSSFNYDKIISDNILKVNGSSTSDIPFKIYFNGNFFGKIKPINGFFSFTITGVNKVKNYLYLQGVEGEFESALIYRDFSPPKIKILSNLNLDNSQNFYFQIDDDILLNYSSINLTLGNENYYFSDDSIDSNLNDIYWVNLSNFLSGSKNYKIEVEDMVGNKVSSYGTLNIVNNDFPLIKKVIFSDSKDIAYGNKLFIKNSTTKIILKPSKFISLKNIYFDNVEVTSYNILNNGNIVVDISNLNLNKNGLIEIGYIDFNHNYYFQNYSYISDLEKPDLDLDYVYKSNILSDELGVITGRIKSDNFNWGTLYFNGENNFNRFGNYFEARISNFDNENNNLNINGEDIFENQIQKIYGSLFYKDISKTEVKKSKVFSGIFKGYLENFDGFRNKNLVQIDNGVESYGSYISPNSFSLALEEIPGLNFLKVFGYEYSGNKFSNLFLLKSIINSNFDLVYDVSSKKYFLFGTYYNKNDLNEIYLNFDNNNLDYSLCDPIYEDSTLCIQINSNLDFNENSKLLFDISDKNGNYNKFSFKKSDIIKINFGNDLGGDEGNSGLINDLYVYAYNLSGTNYILLNSTSDDISDYSVLLNGVKLNNLDTICPSQFSLSYDVCLSSSSLNNLLDSDKIKINVSSSLGNNLIRVLNKSSFIPIGSDSIISPIPSVPSNDLYVYAYNLSGTNYILLNSTSDDISDYSILLNGVKLNNLDTTCPSQFSSSYDICLSSSSLNNLLDSDKIKVIINPGTDNSLIENLNKSSFVSFDEIDSALIPEYQKEYVPPRLGGVTIVGDGSGKIYLSGTLIGSTEDDNITVNLDDGTKVDCENDGTNFLCILNKAQFKKYTIKINDEEFKSGDLEKDENNDLSINLYLLKLFGDNIYKMGSDYYLSGTNFNVEGNSNQNLIISSIINGEEKLFGEHNGTFNLSIDVSNIVGISNSKTIKIKLKGEKVDEDDYNFSDEIKLYYNKVLNTMIKVFVY